MFFVLSPIRTDVFPEFGQSCPIIRDGRPSGATCFSRQVVEFYGGKRHTYHPMSNNFEKSSRSLSSVPVYQGTRRLFRGKSLKRLVVNLTQVYWLTQNQILIRIFATKITNFVDFWLFFLMKWAK